MDAVAPRAVRPRLARGAVSAFALTENQVGSDPAGLTTTATLSEDGTHYVLNGEKCYISNSNRADSIIAFARSRAGSGADGASAPASSGGERCAGREM